MAKIIKTLSRNIEIFFEEYFLIPLIISVILFLILEIILYKTRKNKTENIFSHIVLFAVCFYFSVLFYTTLFRRIGVKTNALSDVFGEWSIYDGETSMYINPKPILNILLFLPICFVILFCLRLFFNKTYGYKKILLSSITFSFSLSLFIELLQLIFCIGTFQLSDLTYNTLGGVIGALIYIVIQKAVRKKEKLHQ